MFLNIVFQSQAFLRLISPVQDLGVGVPDVELKSLTLQEKDLYLCDPPNCGLLWLGCGFLPQGSFLSVSPICLDAVILLFAVEILFIQFSGPFLRKLFHM